MWVESENKPAGQGYLVEIYNVGGSSGSPVVMQPSQVRVTADKQLQVRRIAPYVVGVIKGHPLTYANVFDVKSNSLVQEVDHVAAISSGVAIVEPGENLKTFMLDIAKVIEAKGYQIMLNEAF